MIWNIGWKRPHYNDITINNARHKKKMQNPQFSPL